MPLVGDRSKAELSTFASESWGQVNCKLLNSSGGEGNAQKRPERRLEPSNGSSGGLHTTVVYGVAVYINRANRRSEGLALGMTGSNVGDRSNVAMNLRDRSNVRVPAGKPHRLDPSFVPLGTGQK